MRQNLPVTNNEFLLSEADSLVSVTDEKGRITYCNPAFINASGYGREELLGQPHNLIRHPDMPPEAFRDMWATLQGGLPWTGYVKNRRKNGDFYWVRANATPMMSNGRIYGYLSVRTCPARADCAAAEQLYAQMRQAGSPIRLEASVVHRNSLARRLDQLRRQAGLWGAATTIWGMMVAAVLVAPSLPSPLWLGLSAAFSMCAAWLWRRQQQRSLAELLAHANRLAAGDLSVDIVGARRDHVGQLQQALAQLTVNLRTVVGDTRTAVNEVMAAAHEIATGNMDLSERTESTASSLQETAASITQINSTVRDNSEASRAGSSLARQLLDTADRSTSAVRSMVDTMGAIAESAQRIQSFTTVIEGVAFQTNILSLNAAVEAARAGDAGRGFAVVASEVRALAQRTAEAARQIKLLVDESGQRIVAGNKQSADALRRVDETMQTITQVDTLLNEIRVAAGEQELSIGQINQAVDSLDGNTQQNAAMVEQLAGAAEQLKQQVEEVTNSMNLFKLRAGDTNVAHRDAVDLRKRMKHQQAVRSTGVQAALLHS